MSSFHLGTTKTHGIPIEQLDYKFIEQCKDVKYLEKILSVLRSGEEGHYPHLTTFCEERIKALSPSSRALRTDKPPATAASCPLEEWKKLCHDMTTFLDEIKLKEEEIQKPPALKPSSEMDIPIRSHPGPATSKKRSRGPEDLNRLDDEMESSEADKSKEGAESDTAMKMTEPEVKTTLDTKDLLRRALHHKKYHNYFAAVADLKTVLICDPKNPVAKALLYQVEKLLEKVEFAKKGNIEYSLEEPESASAEEAGVTVGGGETAVERTEMGNAQKKFSPKKGNEKEEVNPAPRHDKAGTENGVKKDSSNGKPKNHVEQQGNPVQPSSTRTGSQEAKLSSQSLPLATQLKNEGNQLFKNGQFGEASTKYTKAIEHLSETGSEDAEELGILYSNRAACHLKDGDCAQCIEDCNKALELQPFSIKPLLRRALANESLEKYRQAYVDYKVVLQLDSGTQLANDSINRITRTLLDIDGPNWREKLPPIPSVPVSTQVQHQEKTMAATNARSDSDKGKSLEENFSSLKQEGNDYVKNNQYREAEKKYTECLALKPEQCVIYTNRALCYLKLRQYEEAKQDCNCALQREASNIKALYRRAQAYRGLEQYQDCANDLRKLLSIDPGLAEPKALLTEITPYLSSDGGQKLRTKILIEEVEETSDNGQQEPQEKTGNPHVTKPSNSLEFEQLMTEMRAGKDQRSCAQLLSLIDPTDLPMLLSNKLDTETLLLIVQSLKLHVLEKNPALVYQHLAQLSAAERFTVVVLLLNKDEKEQVQSVLESLSAMENEDFNQDDISNLTKKYGL